MITLNLVRLYSEADMADSPYKEPLLAAFKQFIAHPTSKNFVAIRDICSECYRNEMDNVHDDSKRLSIPCSILDHPKAAGLMSCYEAHCNLCGFPERLNQNSHWACPLTGRMTKDECKKVYRAFKGELVIAAVIFMERLENQECDS